MSIPELLVGTMVGLTTFLAFLFIFAKVMTAFAFRKVFGSFPPRPKNHEQFFNSIVVPKIEVLTNNYLEAKTRYLATLKDKRKVDHPDVIAASDEEIKAFRSLNIAKHAIEDCGFKTPVIIVV